MRKRGRFIAVGFVLLAIVAAVILAACTPKEKAPVEKAPAPTAPAAAPSAIGMGIGERYHDIHINKLELKCEFCHVKATATYDDPLAQVSNLADRRACLSCHKEGSKQPFYGEAWGKAKVK